MKNQSGLASSWDANPDALKNLPKVRQLLFEGKYREAEKLAQSGIMGSFRRDNASSCQNIWDHYLFGGDIEYLKIKSYPIMKEAAEFCIDWLVKNPGTGYLVSGPSISPENSFKIPGGDGNASLVMGPTMDHMIIRDLLQNTIKASIILDTDKTFRKKMEKTLDNLTPVKTGSDGRILEWSDEFEEAEPGRGSGIVACTA